MAVPTEAGSEEYERLKRVWFDHTWENHPLMDFTHENHLTATLFENFVLFSPAIWIPALIESANVEFPMPYIDSCRWAYEVLDRKSNRLADVAIHARAGTENFVLVIESKRKNGRLKSSDLDPSSYLDLEEFGWCKNRMLIYLVDEADKANVAAKVLDPQKRSGVLTWQDLAGIQIAQAINLDCTPSIKSFVAGAIQHQFCCRGITPSVLSSDYLIKEPRKDTISKANLRKMTDYYTPWRLD